MSDSTSVVQASFHRSSDRPHRSHLWPPSSSPPVEVAARLDLYCYFFEVQTHPEEGKEVGKGKQEAILVAMLLAMARRQEKELEKLELEKLEVSDRCCRRHILQPGSGCCLQKVELRR